MTKRLEGYAYRDLRQWLGFLEESDRLTLAKPGLALRHQVAALAKRLEDRSAILFPSPDQHAVPVVANLLADRGWIAESLGVGEDELAARYQHAVRQPVPWTEVAAGPVQEVVHEDVDIGRQLPVPTHNELDSGPYIAAGLMIARNPETGVQNVSIHRCQISGKDRIGVLLLPRHTFEYAELAARQGEGLEIAIVIGVDPASLLASQAIVPLDFDEMTIAGALHGAPVEMVKCQTNDVRVPARAEIVLEGRILTNEKASEGPFGEFPQYYGARADRHVIRIEAITHRERPIFHTIVGGGREHLLLGGLPREATLLETLQRNFACVRAVHLSLGGVHRYHLVVQIQGQQPGQAKNVIIGAFAGHYDVKQVIAVDGDVDIFNAHEVEWAVATRFQANRDLVVVSGSQGSKLDPTADDGVGAKMGLDATVPPGADDFTFTRIRVPGADELDPAALVDDDRAALAEIIGGGKNGRN